MFFVDFIQDLLYYIEKNQQKEGQSMPTKKFTTEKEYKGHIGINSCGQQWLVDRDYNTVRENGRVDFSIHYIAKGQGYCEYNGKNRLVPEGSLVLFFPKVRHHYFFKKEDSPRMLWSHFSGSACSILAEIKSDEPVFIEIRDKKQFEQAFERMIEAHYNKPERDNQLCNGYMLVLLALIKQSTLSHSESNNKKGNDALEKVLSDMHVYFDKPIDIKKYASQCHLSEDRFIRMFKAHTGLPPYHYQLKVRIERAVEMLENQSVNVSECAEIVGFNDAAYFSRVFKKFTGHPPSYYKK